MDDICKIFVSSRNSHTNLSCFFSNVCDRLYRHTHTHTHPSVVSFSLSKSLLSNDVTNFFFVSNNFLLLYMLITLDEKFNLNLSIV